MSKPHSRLCLLCPRKWTVEERARREAGGAAARALSSLGEDRCCCVGPLSGSLAALALSSSRALDRTGIAKEGPCTITFSSSYHYTHALQGGWNRIEILPTAFAVSQWAGPIPQPVQCRAGGARRAAGAGESLAEVRSRTLRIMNPGGLGLVARLGGRRR